MAGRETYDIDPLQKEILEFKQARRQKLRMKYLEEFHNPYRHTQASGGPVDDVAINRYQAVRATAAEFFKPTTKNAFYMLLVSIVPVAIGMWTMKYLKDKEEKAIRSGQISYRDREFKFR